MPGHPFQRRVWLLVIVVMFFECLVSCRSAITTGELAGTYHLSGEGGAISLELLPNGDFVEHIRPTSGPVRMQRGRWEFSSRSISFDSLWIPVEFAPDYVKKADSNAGNGPKYTNPGSWSIKPERWFGKIVLSVFPDSNVKFEK